MGDIITDLIKAVALGLLQGFTESLPISSSGHLVIAQKLMHIDVSVGFDVMLHVGTLLAVVVFFRKDPQDQLFAGSSMRTPECYFTY